MSQEIEGEMEEWVEEEQEWKITVYKLNASTFAVELLYECGDCSMLDSQQTYQCRLADCSSLHHFLALGYCITHSTCRWNLMLVYPFMYMQSMEGVRLLVQELKEHQCTNYTIDSIRCWYSNVDCAQQLLMGLPQHTLPHIKQLLLVSKTFQPLPHCLPVLITAMTSLRALEIMGATEVSVVSILRALTSAHNANFDLIFLHYYHSFFSGRSSVFHLLYPIIHSDKPRTLSCIGHMPEDNEYCYITTMHGSRLMSFLLLFNNLYANEAVDLDVLVKCLIKSIFGTDLRECHINADGKMEPNA